jgi:hypothetical protein
VRALTTSSITSCNRKPSESDVIHDHIRLRQHQIVAISCIGVCIAAQHMQHAGTTQGSETVGGSSCGSQLSTGGRSTEMINDGCPDPNRKVLVEGVGENCCQRPKRGDLGGRAFRWRLQAPETVISTCSAISAQVRPWSRSSRICSVAAE